MSAYGATKHALNCIGRAARLELAPYGVHVNTVCPGYVETDFSRNAVRGSESLRVEGMARRGITAVRVANAVWDAYRFNRREVVVPWSGNLVVGLYRLLPRSSIGECRGCCAGWISPRRVRLTDWRPGIPPDRRLESRRARGRGNSRPACPRSAAQSLAELRDPAPACPDHRWS